LPCSFSFPALYRLTAVIVLGLVLGAFAVSCSGRDRRMGEREALDFRRNLVRNNYGNLSPAQRVRIMYHPARTRREIRLTLDDYMRKTSQLRAREEAERSGRAATGRQRKALGIGEGDVGGDPAREGSGTGGVEPGPPPDDSSSDKEGADG
jgi:hypothetical protein